MRALRSSSHSTPTFQPTALSEPSMRAPDSRPAVACAIALNVAEPGAMPFATAALSSAAE
jgi:hypothetical protein